ncbi:hypothetical protein ACIBG8_32240 [Nonomuraea sp. NPDC050556]|uniref:hypothetical protein n=1 Tax=Nonomuraea sp. NPDC050556 TaxID=3364369 RepID=UPI0037BCFFBA
MTGSSTGDELRAAVSARRDLGPEFEDAIVESFLDKMGKEVDRRVDERLATYNPKAAAKAAKSNEGMRLALAIVSMSLGTVATIALLFADVGVTSFITVWAGIVLVNLAWSWGGRRS